MPKSRFKVRDKRNPLIHASDEDVKRGIFPSVFVANNFMIPVDGEILPFSFNGRRYLIPIYNTPAPRVLLMCGRQVEKTVTEQTLIRHASGELVPIKDLEVGDELACLSTFEEGGVDTASGSKMTTSHIVWKSRRYRKPCRRIRTRQGHVSDMATTHPVRVWGGYREAGSLKPGDRIGVVRKAGKFHDRQVNESRVKLTAFIIGDGGCDKSLNFTNNNAEVLDDFSESLTKEGMSYTDGKLKGSATRMCLPKYRAQQLWDWLEEDELLGTNSYTKFIPSWVFHLPKDQTALFINRLWSTDGHVKKNTRSKWSIEYCSMSKSLVLQLQSLLHKFGIPSRIRENWPIIYRRRGEKKLAYILRVETQEGVVRFIRDIGALGKIARKEIDTWTSNNNSDTYPLEVTQLVRDIYEEVSPVKGDRTLRSCGIERLPRGNRCLTRGNLEMFVEFFSGDPRYSREKLELLREHLDSDVYWDRIEEIEDLGQQWCYDLTVKDHHNFIADSIITHNSTSLGNMLITYSCLRKHFRALFVSPAEIQTQQFSNDKIETPISNSPNLKEFITGQGTKSNVMHKKFITKSELWMRYAFLHADRTRGISADMVMIDEIQDIIAEVIPVIEETMFTSSFKIRRYSGTPKSADNTLAVYWDKYSTQNQWVIPCDRCGNQKFRYWNVVTMKSIQPHGLSCTKCGKVINPLHKDAQWASFYTPDPKDAGIPYHGYRIPQPLSPFAKWDDIMDKKLRYPRGKFYNEVLGLPYDSGDKPLVKATIKAQCRPGLKLNPPSIKNQRPASFMGIDWGTGENSFTVVMLGHYVGERFEIFYAERLDGEKAEPVRQMQAIHELIRRYKPSLIGADYGGGFRSNDELVRAYGKKRVFTYQYANTNNKFKWQAGLGRYIVNRNAVLEDVINAINRRTEFNFPRWEDFEEPFADDMCNIFTEYNEGRRLTVINKRPDATDDSLHAFAYCFLVSMIKHPRPDIIAPMGD